MPVKLPTNVRMSPEEEVLYSTRTHPKILFLPVLALLTVAVLTYFAFAYIQMAWASGWVLWISLGTLAVLAIKYALWPYLQWQRSLYFITNKQIIMSKGVLNQKTHSSQLSRISDLNVERGVLDRIFHCGTLVIYNAAGGLSEGAVDSNSHVVLKDVPKVLDIEQKIKEMVFHA